MDLFLDGHRYWQVGEARAEAKEASRKVADITEDLHRAEQRAEKAILLAEALWTLMREKLGVTDEELLKRIHELDQSDGKLDGKVRREGVLCDACGRKSGRGRPRCIYCGADLKQSPFA